MERLLLANVVFFALFMCINCQNPIIFPTEQTFTRMENKLASIESKQGWVDGSLQPPSEPSRLRLRGGTAPSMGYVQIYDQEVKEWRILCDPNSQSWGLQQAQVVCRQLGYLDGVLHTSHGSFLQGQSLNNLIKDSKAPAKPSKVKCSGEERSLRGCDWSDRENVTLRSGKVTTRPYSCNVAKDAVGVVCNTQPLSFCPEDTWPFGDKCYEIRSEPLMTFEKAGETCKAKGGHLIEIRTLKQNTYITETLLLQQNEGQRFWTGGITNFIAGKDFHIWLHSTEVMTFFGLHRQPHVHSTPTPNGVSNQVYGVALTLKSGEGSLEGLLHQNMINDTFVEWVEHDLNEKLGLICELPQTDIGCVKEQGGADYNGTASRADSGLTCLPWTSTGIQQLFDGQVGWDHNYCRNPDGQEESPICFTDKDTIDYCTIPTCSGLTNRRHILETNGNIFEEMSVNQKFDICNDMLGENIFSGSKERLGDCSINQPERFSCKPDECIFNKYVCDGENDCSGGEDEANCIQYTDLFKKETGYKIQYSEYDDKTLRDVEVTIPNVENEEMCARMCIQSKRCTCNSFSYNANKKRCIITNRFITPYDALIKRKYWNYYTLDEKNPATHSIMAGCGRVKRPAQSHIEGIRLNDGVESDVVEVKLNGTWGGICDDGFTLHEADIVCKQLGFHLGAEEVFRNQGENPQDIIHLYGLECSGDESQITQCKLEKVVHGSTHICSGLEKVGVRCRKTSKKCDDDFEWHCGSKDCIHVNDLCDGVEQCADGSDESHLHCSQDFQIRLADGHQHSDDKATIGRLEVKHKGVWGTVCDDYFGELEAKVVCRMLGFDVDSGDVASVYNGSVDFRAVGGPVWVRFTETDSCEGDENSLTECKQKDLWQHDHHCTHDEDISVRCEKRVSNLQNNIFAFESDIKHELVTDRILNPSELEDKIDEFEFMVPQGVQDCGETFETDIRSFNVLPRIHGGDVAFVGANPWQASIRVLGPDRSYHWCGASILSHFHVITAAHCVQRFPPDVFLVRVGDHTLGVVDEEEQEFKVADIIFHENFNLGLYLNNDIAVVKIAPNSGSKGEEGIKFGVRVAPVCLPSAKFQYIPTTNVTVSGWGRIEAANRRPKKSVNGEASYFGGSDTLREVKLPVISKSTCGSSQVYGNDQLSSGMFCAGKLEGGADACKGDSGGPAVTKIRGRSTLIGITSWGLGCGLPDRPGVYTKVAKYVDWIQQILRS